MREIKVRDVTLRDGQQSQFATRMKGEQIARLLPYYKDANFYAMEVWGGAVPDSCMRFLNENPWDRLQMIKEGIGDISKLTALSRGRNLFGYAPYPEDVIEGFIKNSHATGLDIMRVFDALNDVDNMRSSIKYVKEYGGIADCAICYTVDPKFSFKDKFNAFLGGKKLPNNIFNEDYYLEKAKELEAAGADIITVKDMAGLLTPHKAASIVKRLKEEIKIPVNLHTHCTPGFGLASSVAAIVSGVDIIDTVIMNFAGGPANPPFEMVAIFLEKLGIKHNVNLEAVAKINKELRVIREELSEYDTIKLFPKEIDLTNLKLEPKIDKLFDIAIELAKEGKYDELLGATQEIEKYFSLPKPNENVKNAEIPGGMYTNMVAQLKQLKLEDLMDEVLKIVPLVRVKAGCPPLVTPTSQIVGSQSVNYVIDKEKGEEPFTNNSVQFVNLVKGEYGKTPFPVDPEFRLQIAKTREEIPYDTSKYKKQDNPIMREYGGGKLAQNEKDELLLELFPAVAKNFLKKARKEEFDKLDRNPVKPKVKITDSILDSLYDDDWY